MSVFVNIPRPTPNHNPTLNLALPERDLDYYQIVRVSSVAQVPPFHRIL